MNIMFVILLDVFIIFIACLLLDRLYTIWKSLFVEIRDGDNKLCVITFPIKDNIHGIDYELSVTVTNHDKRRALTYTLPADKHLNYKIVSTFVEIFYEGGEMISKMLEEM